MILLQDKNNLVVDSKLKPLPISISTKLNFIGFQKVNKNYYVHQGLTLALFKDVLRFFKNEDIDIEIDHNLARTIKHLENEQNQYQDLAEYLSNFKNGKVNKKDYQKFYSLLTNSSFKRNLLPHQRKAAFHLFKAGTAANFSVPGSGKTTVVLSVFQCLKELHLTDNIFIIGPLSCHPAWVEEYKKCFGIYPTVNIFAGGDIDAQFTAIESKEKRRIIYNDCSYKTLNLSTFATVTNDIEYLENYIRKINPILVIDEAHYIKREDGDWASSILRLAKHAKYKTILTGTPMPQSFSDLFNLFDFLLLDNSPLDKSIKNQICKLEEKNKLAEIQSILEDRISPYFYRVRKTELSLPEQINHTIPVKMNPIEKQVHDFMTSTILKMSKNDYLETAETRRRLQKGRAMRLRQVYSNVSLLKTTLEGIDYDENLYTDIDHIIDKYENSEKPAKLDVLISMVKAHIKKNEKLVVWSNFIKNIKFLELELKAIGVSCQKIIGETPTKTNKKLTSDVMLRPDIVKDFNKENGIIQVILANPAACAESISLHKFCNNAIYYDLSYNTAQYLQSLDRIHRVGSSKVVASNYYILNYEETLENEVRERVLMKADKMNMIMDNDYAVYDLDMSDSYDDIEFYRHLTGNND